MKIENLKVKYQDKDILDINYLEINTKKITALMGTNGSGKSTLLRILSFIEKPFSGNIIYNGKNKLSNIELKNIVILLPEPTLLKRNVYENFKFVLKNQGQVNNFNNAICESLELVGLNESFLKKKYYQLSSGQTQKIAFALTLCTRAKFYLLDEPTNSLDISSVKLFSNAIEYMQSQYKSGFMIASHDEKWLSAFCNENIFLYNGKISDFEIKNMFSVSTFENLPYIDFGNNLKIYLPMFCLSSQQIAINSSLINISTSPFLNAHEGHIHSISIIYKTKLLIKIKFGSYLIKCLIEKTKLLKELFYPTQKLYFTISDDAFKPIK